MPSRSPARRRRSVPSALVLCAGLLAGVMLPDAAHAAGAGTHPQISRQIIGGSRDQRGATVSPGVAQAAAAAPRVRNAR